jgi:carbamoyltransferase
MTQRDWDLARTVQDAVETAVLRMADYAHRETGAKHLCMAGGVALNCVANGRLLREGPFESIWVQPAAGDAGSAVGAALWYWHEECGGERTRPEVDVQVVGRDQMRVGQLGPSFSAEEIGMWLESEGVPAEHVPDVDERCEKVAGLLADGAVIGWFEGSMEFGPRALGHRSIIADPRSTTVQRDINLRVKGRESFRPFAPAVLWEFATDWFRLHQPSPYMLQVCQVAPHRLLEVDHEPTDPMERVQVPRSEIPACTHVDGSARVQTVDRERSPAFYELLEAFGRRTGCPVLLNTSFNRADEPVVRTPADALRCAALAGLDLLVLERCLVRRPALEAVAAARSTF